MGLLSQIAFTGVNGLIADARKSRGSLTLERLRETRPTPEVVSVPLREAWAAEVGGGKPSLRRALQRTYWREVAVAAGFKLAWSALIVTCASFFVR